MSQSPALPRVKRGLCFVLLVALLAAFGTSPLAGQSPSADVLLTNANVITMDPKLPAAQAIAIRGERIAWVGSNAEAKKLFPKTPRIVDLRGATILPGQH